MASTCNFFDEDAVYKVNKKKFVDVGLVVENSEFLSSDEEPNTTALDDDWEKMKRGHVRIAWHPHGVEEVVSERKVKLCDRSLMPGDVVRKIIKGKDTQLGYCRFTVVKADVQIVGTQKIISDVDSRELVPLEEYGNDIAIYKDSWVGMIKNVKIDLILVFSDGSRCSMPDEQALNLEDLSDHSDKISDFKKYVFYPGQQLWGPSFCYQKVKWLNTTENMQKIIESPTKTVRCTVEEVNNVSLAVQWVCRAYGHQSTDQPKYHICGDDLKSVKMMNIFEPCTLQVGDRNFLVLKDSHEVISLKEWKNRMSRRMHLSFLNSPGNILSKLKKTGKEDESTENEATAEAPEEFEAFSVEDCNSDDFEDMEDEDSEKSSDASSVVSSASSVAGSVDSMGRKKKKKVGLRYMNAKKKWLKVKRRAFRNTSKQVIQPGTRYCTETRITQTKADVVWQDGTVERDIMSTLLYPVHHLDGHEFFPGDYVVDNKDSKPYEYGVIKKVDHSGRTALVTWLKTYHAGGDPHPEFVSEQEVSVYDVRDHPDFKYRPGACVIRVVNTENSNSESTAGQVVDVHVTGQVEVAWVNGSRSQCYPQELYRVGEYDSDDLWADDESVTDDDSWETESEKSVVGQDDEPSLPSSANYSALEKELDGTAKDLEKLSLKLEDKDLQDGAGEDMQEKLLANIEKLRAGMARLEEVFMQNPTLQTCNVMKRLLELYKHCKVLDQLLGTTYFHEKHLQLIIEKVRQRRANSNQHIADQVFRHFFNADSNNSELNDARLISATDSNLEPPTNGNNNSTSDDTCEVFALPKVNAQEENRQGDTDSKVGINIRIDYALEKCLNDITTATNWTAEESTLQKPKSDSKPLLSPISPTSSDPRNLCQQLCATLKSRLLKAHEDAEHRFGMPRSETQTQLQLVDSSDSPPNRSIEEAVLNGVGGVDNTSENNKTDTKDEKEDADVSELNDVGQGIFSVLESVPDSHKYKLSIFQPQNPSAFFKIVKKEMNILRSSLPDGITVKSFEDRIDLYSVLIKGPKKTPYEDGLFFFDFQLSAEYPHIPPHCHYVSYCSERLNPNLYEGGKVCVSLLGTWGGKGTEMWNPKTSNLLQVLVSIQGLILVSEPYYNEAGYERQKGTQLGMENSRMYNEMVVLKLVQSMTKLLNNPPDIFKQEIIDHFKLHAAQLVNRLEKWLTISEIQNAAHPESPTSPNTFKELYNESNNFVEETSLPEFPLIPASKGFCLTLRKTLADFKDILKTSTDIIVS